MNRGEPPVYARSAVRGCEEIAPSVFKLTIENPAAAAAPGRFYMLRAYPSARFLMRPISVYYSDADKLEFLILLRGRGTAELSLLRAGMSVDILGPIGEGFALPAELITRERSSIALVSGGIGVAPVAGFAASLKAESYDFYASFRASPYGLERVSAANLYIATEDGSRGTKGTLPAVFNAGVCAQKKYAAVYACGPEPMLAYVKRVCLETESECYVCMERRMACGMGACLGCVVSTASGNRRVCADGPVFNAREVLL